MRISWRTVTGAGSALAVAATMLVQAPLSSAAEVTPKAAICNRFCDGRDPKLSPADRLSATTTLSGRSLELHFDDTDAMVWASLQKGRPGDTFWMDRSFDGGRTWASGSRIAATTIPAGVTGWRGTMVNVDNWAANGIGAVRACAQPGGTGAIGCTAWARTTWNAYDRRTAAATALMMSYNTGTGLFSTAGWWNNANALTALIETMRVSGLTGYRYVIATTYAKQLNAHKGQFRNDFIDDTGWWGLAWIAAYDLTGDARYLATARADADYMHRYWDSAGCGGVYWRVSKTGKTAIANSLYLQLNAALARRVPGDTTYRARATASWTFWKASGLVNAEGLVNDSVNNTTCKKIDNTMWTYNAGNAVNAFVEYNRLTDDVNPLNSAKKVATAMTTSPRFNAGGVFREQCEPGCSGDGDGASFKGAAIRGIGHLNQRAGGFTGWLDKQADTAYAKNRTRLDQYGFHWAGPFDSTDGSRQHSALDLMNAAP
jgi:hypothetical protein